MTIVNRSHRNTLLNALARWRENDPDICFVSKEGEQICTHTSIIRFYSTELCSIFNTLPSCSSIYSISLDASSASISALLSILWTGEATSDNIDDLSSVDEVAKILGIKLDNCDFETISDVDNIDIKEEESQTMILMMRLTPNMKCF